MLERILPSEVEQIETAVGFIFYSHISRMSMVLFGDLFYNAVSIWNNTKDVEWWNG
jgi:hypothetical protein